ncbi:ABC transporter ATP-binding protein [Arthrobacter sp. Marseille-P9274]|uniref:ABC transporter ATP-binding protein n=1 Tax=Arthrobacter sp. Marseille-P9274 TaxID=2866572 RepID=UPI0021C5A3E1|nr:ABC transporter ATP-binding protein [Arthrobacter sp. Marseille-P9274]
MLEVNDLHVSYGSVNAVRGVSMSASAGRVTLVLGSNGAGKTTSLRAIHGLLKARSGSVKLDGKEILGQSAHRQVRQGVVMVPEGRRIFASLTVEENLRMGAYAVSRSDAQHTVAGIYEKFPILLERKAMPGGLLSGGEQQMLAFGRAMMSQPKVVLLDEPSMGLAPGMVDRVMSRVRGIADTGIAVFMVEQNADAALAVADDVVLVQRGEVVWTGTAEEAQTDTALVHAFLGEAALGA